MLKTLLIVALLAQTGFGSPVAKTGPENENAKVDTGVKNDGKECCGHLTEEQKRPVRDLPPVPEVPAVPKIPEVPPVPNPSGEAKPKRDVTNEQENKNKGKTDSQVPAGEAKPKRDVTNVQENKNKGKADSEVPCCGQVAPPEAAKSPA